MGLRKMRKRLKTIRDAESKLAHRVWEGVKGMKPKDLAAFIIREAAAGFAEGMIREAKRKNG